jgi:DNA repair protein RadA/Sms
VLGGGVVRGSLVLIGGDPGIGKSTLLLQAARALARVASPVLYVSAEESAAQVKMRADRLGIVGDGLLLWAENDLSAVQAELDTIKPRVLVSIRSRPSSCRIWSRRRAAWPRSASAARA